MKKKKIFKQEMSYSYIYIYCFLFNKIDHKDEE